MGIFQFKVLDELEQLELVWDIGVKVAEIKDGVYMLDLFQIDDFYVQRKTHIEHNYLIALDSFTPNDERLTPYLQLIPLPK